MKRIFNLSGWTGVAILALFLVILAGTIPWQIEAAGEGKQDIGRYQVSAWASYSGGRVHHSGYYVVDTVTGKIVDRGHEIHGIDGQKSGEN